MDVASYNTLLLCPYTKIIPGMYIIIIALLQLTHNDNYNDRRFYRCNIKLKPLTTYNIHKSINNNPILCIVISLRLITHIVLLLTENKDKGPVPKPGTTNPEGMVS